jgi:hypothetical protein
MRTVQASALAAAFALAVSAAATSALAKFPGQLQPGPNEIAEDATRVFKNNETKEFDAKFDPVRIQKMKIRIETDNGNTKRLTTITEGVTPQCMLVGLEDNKPARLYAVVTDGQIVQRVALRSFTIGKANEPLTEVHRSAPLHVANPTELTLVFHGRCLEK